MQTEFDNLIVLGAGSDASTELDNEQGAQTYLVEGDADKAAQLKKRYDSQQAVVVINELISADGEPLEFYRYNLPEFDGPLKAEALKELFPGLRENGKETLPSKSICSLTKELGFNEKQSNTLIINLPGQELKLLKALVDSNLLHKFSAITCYTSSEKLFVDGSVTSETTSLLNKAGFDDMKSDGGTNTEQQDPDFPVIRFKRNELVLENRALKEQVEQIKAELKQESDKHDKALSEERKKHTEEVLQLTQKNNELQQEVKKAKQDVEQNEKILEKLSQLEEKSQKQISNATKQIESFIGVQHLLETGETPMLSTETPASHELTLFLMSKIRKENFDLVIEFGAGASTVLLAKSMSFNRPEFEESDGKYQNKRIGDDKRATESRDVVEYHDLPTRILTLEHKQTNIQDVAASLRANHLENLVDLVHSPLVDFKYDGKHYLHYDCEAKLKDIAELFRGRSAKILVLVNGPPAAVCEQARFPALPRLLQYLSTHEFHLVLEDYAGDDEKNAAVRWSQMFAQRELSLEKKFLPFQKPGFCWIVNK